MLDHSVLPPMADAVDAAKDFLRLDESGDDALIAGLVAGAIETCEAVVGTALITRPMREVLPAQAAWRWLAAAPVRTIAGVTALAADGTEIALAPQDYEIDIDSEARGRVRLMTLPTPSRIVVRYSAGRADGWSGLPIALRHAVLRLVSHGYAFREASEVPAMPTAVTALLAPMRRMRLG